ncbi:MAG: GGDEF domain-containing protein [Oleispira sp.]|nr:GGDEF domain-containing protein [Oleispira sp.]
MSLRLLIPVLLLAFTLLSTLIGYAVIRADLTEEIEQQSLRYMNIELSKLQSLIEPLLAKKDIRGIKSLYAFKASELDNKAMLIVNEKNNVIASSHQQDVLNNWHSTKLNINSAYVDKTIRLTRSLTYFSNDRKLLDGYINLCVRDLTKGLRSFSCGFLYYQIDVNYRQHRARTWLTKQSLYIALGSGFSAFLLLLLLHYRITRRVIKIKSALDLWSKGDRETQIKLNGKDELNHIGHMINTLVKQFSRDEKALIFSQQVNDAIIQSANYSIIATDTQGVINTFNSSAEKMLGYDKSELIDKKTPGIFHDIAEVIARNKVLSKELGISIKPGFDTLVARARKGEIDENNWTYIHKDGHIIPVHLSVTALYNSHGHINGFLGIAYDISKQLEAEEKLEQLAYFDQLTQLPNRMLYNDRLNQTISFAERNKYQFSIFFIDLDKFKFVNDSFGHEIGDKLLIKVAKIISSCIRKSDTVARLGGDEFTVILPGLDKLYDKPAISLIAKKVIDKLSKTIVIDDHNLNIGASIGIAIFPQDGLDISSLNKHADIAMYQAKDQGRSQYCFYDPKSDSTLANTD